MLAKKKIEELAYEIIGAAIEVHRELGPGLLESVYERCFKKELDLRHIDCRTQVLVPVLYKGEAINADLRLDILVEDLIVVELKAVESFLPIFDAQILTYMKLLKKPKGLLFNFNSTNLTKEGLRSMVNDLYSKLQDE